MTCHLDHSEKNFLEETRDALAMQGLSPPDVLRVAYGSDGGAKYVGSWADFEALANHQYSMDNMHFALPTSCFVLHGEDWWMDRYGEVGNYGCCAESWMFHKRPSLPDAPLPLAEVTLSAADYEP